MPEFEIKKRENEMRVSTEPEGFWFEARQNLESESYLIVTQSSAEAIYLGDEIVQIDQTLSDAEIVASLESVKKKLFDIFGVSFTDVRIERYFDGYSQHGATSISAFFTTPQMSRLRPISGINLRIIFAWHFPIALIARKRAVMM